VKLLVILIVVALAGFVGYSVFHGRVDQTNPDAVATAFMKAVKANNIGKASKYWVPADAEAWQKTAEAKVQDMHSGTFNSFFENFPAEPVFKTTHAPKAPANEKTLSCDGGLSVDVRQIENKWYVCKAPL
jgi:hypothetical protein